MYCIAKGCRPPEEIQQAVVPLQAQGGVPRSTEGQNGTDITYTDPGGVTVILLWVQGEAGRVEAELGESREFTREEQRQRFLENEIHKTTLVQFSNIHLTRCCF